MVHQVICTPSIIPGISPCWKINPAAIITRPLRDLCLIRKTTNQRSNWESKLIW